MRSEQPWVLPVAGLVLGLLVSVLLGPRPLMLGDAVGDRALVADARAALGDPAGYGTVSVARLRDGRIAWAGFGSGVSQHARYELGSITKTFDGLLLADAVERGEVHLDGRLETYLPELAGTAAGDVTLEELATHRSGLPSSADMGLPRTAADDLAGRALTMYTATTPAALIQQTERSELSGRGTARYSNLGASLLGHALARAANAPDWPSYVEERLFAPLAMTDTHIWPGGEPDPAVVRPHRRGGRPVEAWTSDGYAPAGASTTTTASDMVRYAQAIVDGTAPGRGALSSRWPYPIRSVETARIGLAWMSSGSEDQPVHWHNGGTAGTRTALAIDLATGEAVVILNGSNEDVTGAALAMLGVDDWPPRWAVGIPESEIYALPALLAVLVLAVGSLRSRSRLGLVARTNWAVAGIVLLGLSAPWTLLPGQVFGAAAGLVVGGVAVTVLRWGRLPWQPRRFTWLVAAMLALGAALLAWTMVVVVMALGIS